MHEFIFNAYFNWVEKNHEYKTRTFCMIHRRCYKMRVFHYVHNETTDHAFDLKKYYIESIKLSFHRNLV